MNDKEILVKARELLSDKDNWTQGEYARDSAGNITCPIGDSATCWCVYGALIKYTGLSTTRALESTAAEKLHRAAKRWQNAGPVQINDNQGYEAVLALLDKAISSCGG